MPDSIRKTCPPQSVNPEWENYLKAWEKSGLSKAEYCRQKNISYHALQPADPFVQGKSTFLPVRRGINFVI
jgi:hypothetical protein